MICNRREDTPSKLLGVSFYNAEGKFMYTQDYCIHLINGEQIILPGERNIPENRTIPGKFKEAKTDDVITYGDPDFGYFYIPKRHILFIRAIPNGE